VEHSIDTPFTRPRQWQQRGELINLLGHSLFVVDEKPAPAQQNAQRF